MAIRCVIIDDSFYFRRAARQLLELEGISVVGMASSGAEALRRVGQLRPDVVLLDVDLGGDSGIEVTQSLTENVRTVGPGDGWRPVIILTSTRPEEDFADLLAGCAADGYLSKSALSGNMIKTMVSRRAG